jgi:hypothetical protein
MRDMRDRREQSPDSVVVRTLWHALHACRDPNAVAVSFTSAAFVHRSGVAPRSNDPPTATGRDAADALPRRRIAGR